MSSKLNAAPSICTCCDISPSSRIFSICGSAFTTCISEANVANPIWPDPRAAQIGKSSMKQDTNVCMFH